MMKCYLYDKNGIKILKIEDKIPECGDYCDTCGDCLKCFSDDTCPSEIGHFWVEYED